MGNLILKALVVLFLGLLLVIKMAFILAVLPFMAPIALALILIAALTGGVEWVELQGEIVNVF
jgi:hypothetical protein